MSFYTRFIFSLLSHGIGDYMCVICYIHLEFEVHLICFLAYKCWTDHVNVFVVHN